MKEKVIKRLCLLCNVKKQTTVHKYEEKNYVCEQCLRDGKDLLLNYADRIITARQQAGQQARDNYHSLIIAGIIIGFIAGMVLTAIYVKYIGG